MLAFLHSDTSHGTKCNRSYNWKLLVTVCPNEGLFHTYHALNVYDNFLSSREPMRTLWLQPAKEVLASDRHQLSEEAQGTLLVTVEEYHNQPDQAAKSGSICDQPHLLLIKFCVAGRPCTLKDRIWWDIQWQNWKLVKGNDPGLLKPNRVAV